MTSQFVGEVRIVGFNFAPKGWSFCDGTLIPISQNEALFSLLGTAYGGDGTTNFALPNLISRMPIGQGDNSQGTNFVVGQSGGQETVSLTANQTASHSHVVKASGGASDSNSPAGKVAAEWSNEQFTTNSPNALMNNGMVTMTGGDSLPHENMMPFLAVNFIIALEGIWPSRQ